MGKVLITGYTGNIGKYVVEGLLRDNVEIVCASRKVKKRERVSNLQEVVPFDFLKSETYEQALLGVDRVFLVRPPHLATPKKDMHPFLKFVSEKGIECLVFVSLLGVEKNPIAPHRKIENLVTELQIPHIFLRPSFFMQNLSTTHRDDILLRDEIAVPVGNALTSFIDTKDIAEVAVKVLTNVREHQYKTYTLTGSEAISYFKVAKTFSSVLGRPIKYRKLSYIKFRNETIQKGVNKNFATIMMLLYFITRMGNAKKVTKDVEYILNREPRTFLTFVKENKDTWMRK